jgi:hypothetical protein
MIEKLDGYKHKFGWIGEYDNFFYSQIIPHIQTNIKGLSEESRFALVESLNLFFEQLKKMVAFECSKSTKIQLKMLLGNCEKRLQECAIEFLQKTGKVDIVLVGMRKPSYVADITAINL